MTEEEEEVLIDNNSASEEIKHKREKSLIGKVCTNRVVGKDLISNTMTKFWRISKRAIFQELGKNTYVITFGTHADMYRILEGKPWSFDTSLFLIMPYDGTMMLGKMVFYHEAFWMQIYNLYLGCMSVEWGTWIGNSVGRTIEVGTEDDNVGWGRFLLLTVELLLHKAIPRGRFIDVDKSKHLVSISI